MVDLKHTQQKIIEKTTSLYSEKHARRFVVIGDPKDNYGGAQQWFYTYLHNKRMAGNGCASIAAANIFYYFYQNDNFKTPLPVVMSAKKPTPHNFTRFAALFYKIYTPQTVRLPFTADNDGIPVSFGLWSAGAFIKGVTAFAQRQRIGLTGYKCSNNGFKSYNTAVEFIECGLKHDCPVAMLITFNKYIKQTKKKNPSGMAEAHWVTITSIKRTNRVEWEYDAYGQVTNERVLDKNDDSELTISTWGRRETISSFRSLWESGSPYVTALRLFPLTALPGLFMGFASVSLVYFTGNLIEK